MPSASRTSAPAVTPQPLWLSAVALAIGYYLAATLGHALSPPGEGFVTFWLPSGLYLAALLLSTRRQWPALFAAAVVANATFDFLHGQPPIAIALFSLTNSTEALVGAWLVRRFVAEQPSLDSPAQVVRFLAVAVGLGPMVGAVIGATTVTVALGGDHFSRTWLMWWSGDATGILLLTPLLLAVRRPRTGYSDAAPSLHRLIAVIALISTAVIAWFAITEELQHGLGLKFLTVPIVLIASVRFGPRWGLVGVLIVAFVFAFCATHTAGLVVAAHASPETMTISLQSYLVVLGSTVLVLGGLLDERHRRETALQESQALLSSIVDGTSDAIYVKDHLGRYLLVNSAVCHIVGKPVTAILGRDDTALFPAPEARTIMAGDETVMTGAVPLTYEENVTDSAGIRRTYSSTKGPIRDARGELRGLFGIARDITERKLAETERAALTAALERKNHELESLVYITSHDLRSPLLNIHGFSQRLQAAAESLQRAAATPDWSPELRHEVTAIGTERIPKALGFILSSVQKMERLIEGLLRLSRLGRADLQPERLDLNTMLEAIRNAMAHQLQTAAATVEIGPLPPIFGDAAQINQLFSNLLDNAVKYRDPARPLELRITGLVDGDSCTFTVADNGTGIPTEHLEKIWELFHRAPTVGTIPGEGLGLSLVRRIVERHHGSIRAESEVGRGTRFLVTLPAGPGAATSA